MPTMLVKNADHLVTMDGGRREIAGGGIYIENGVITAVGVSGDLPETADEVIDATNCVVTPGLINTHHHFYQN